MTYSRRNIHLCRQCARKSLGTVWEIGNWQESWRLTTSSLHYFLANNVYCSKCGGFLQPTQCGNAMKCSTCPKARTLHRRMDGAAIMLITSSCQHYALLGRKAAWPSGRYSTLAGFCQVAEILEQCVVQEVSEGWGVVVDPFSLMFGVGFQAIAENSLPLITFDDTELDTLSLSKDVSTHSSDTPTHNSKGLIHCVCSTSSNRNPTFV